MSYHRCDVPEHADLEDEVRRLTSEVQEEHRWSSGWRDLALRTEAEVKRLRDGIAWLTESYHSPEVVTSELRALLDGEDDA